MWLKLAGSLVTVKTTAVSVRARPHFAMFRMGVGQVIFNLQPGKFYFGFYEDRDIKKHKDSTTTQPTTHTCTL